MIAAILPERHGNVFRDKTSQGQRGLGLGGARPLSADVRRPTRGIQLKEGTFAVLQILKGDGTPIPLVNAGSKDPVTVETAAGPRTSVGYANFLVQQVTEQRVEKQQIVETFGEAFIFFFGERPRIMSVQGILINTFDFNWEAEWWDNYENLLRGTRCVETDSRVYLSFDETLVSGYIMGASAEKTSQERNYVSFQFQMFVVDYASVSHVGSDLADQTGQDPVNPYRKENRPNLVPFYPSPLELDSGGGLSLFAGWIAGGAHTLQKFWNKTVEITNNAMISLSSFVGNPVRVPVGYEGVFVFGDGPAPKLDDMTATVIVPGPIRMRRFSENSDEYVKESDQYSGASLSYGEAFSSRYLPNRSLDWMTISRTAAMEFAKVGLIVPPPMLAGLISAASSVPVGAKLLGKAQHFLAVGKANMSSNLAVAAPYASTALGVAGGAATGIQGVKDLVGSSPDTGTLSLAHGNPGRAISDAVGKTFVIDDAGRSNSLIPGY